MGRDFLWVSEFRVKSVSDGTSFACVFSGLYVSAVNEVGKILLLTGVGWIALVEFIERAKEVLMLSSVLSIHTDAKNFNLDGRMMFPVGSLLLVGSPKQ